MNAALATLDRIEERLILWMARHAITALRVSLGTVFLWFGVLKFFPGLSPAEDLAARTITALTFGAVGPAVSLPVLATWETAIGLGLVTGRCLRAALLLLFAQMAGTVLPLFFFPGETWSRLPYAATLEGQYIIKNLVLVSAGLVIGATLRGGALAGGAERRAQPARAPSRRSLQLTQSTRADGGNAPALDLPPSVSS